MPVSAILLQINCKIKIVTVIAKKIKTEEKKEEEWKNGGHGCNLLLCIIGYVSFNLAWVYAIPADAQYPLQHRGRETFKLNIYC
jgi:hypothetical protein